MLLGYYGYPQRQPSIPGYGPEAPELLQDTWNGPGATRVGTGPDLGGSVGPGALGAAWRGDESRRMEKQHLQGKVPCLHPSEMRSWWESGVPSPSACSLPLDDRLAQLA